jgi:hypothetical protein
VCHCIQLNDWDGSPNFLPGLIWTPILLIPISQVAGITVMNHWALLCF